MADNGGNENEEQNERNEVNEVNDIDVIEEGIDDLNGRLQDRRQQAQRLQAQLQLEQRNLGAQHQALLRFRDSTVAEDYVRPNLFPLRIALLLVAVVATAVAISLIFFFLPGKTRLNCFL